MKQSEINFDLDLFFFCKFFKKREKNKKSLSRTIMMISRNQTPKTKTKTRIEKMLLTKKYFSFIKYHIIK